MSKEDFLSIGIESARSKAYSEEDRPHRNLLIAIIEQAIHEALNEKQMIQCKQARRFLDKTNPIFCFYCQLLDVDPEYLAKKVTLAIKQRVPEHKDHKAEKCNRP